MLKEIHCKLVPFLTKLFNHSISIGSFPDEFKFAIVKPSFKQKGNATDTNNYRDIIQQNVKSACPKNIWKKCWY